jgi:hypothetical protein
MAAEEHSGSATPASCGQCGGAIVWEAIEDEFEERWLGLCRECGRMTAFLPEQPTHSPRDPLRTCLLGAGVPLRPASPAWIRVFRVAGSLPWVRWLHEPDLCPTCETHVTFRAQGHPRPGVLADCRLCLSCGRVSVEHIRPGTTLHETPAVGGAWSPPCPAVARLRQAILRPFWRDQRLTDPD